jgi:hypothetical protein
MKKISGKVDYPHCYNNCSPLDAALQSRSVRIAIYISHLSSFLPRTEEQGNSHHTVEEPKQNIELTSVEQMSLLFSQLHKIRRR